VTAALLPAVVLEYLRLAGSARTTGVDAVLACFTDDAEVDDFEDVRIGAEAIRLWWQGPATAYNYTVELLGGHALGSDRFVAFTRLVGDFPGGTAELADRFALRDGLIAKLEIVASDPTGDR